MHAHPEPLIAKTEWEKDMPEHEWLTAPQTLVDVATQRAARDPDKVAFTYCGNGEEESDQLTYRQLDHRARRIASLLQQQNKAGEHVLVLCPSGLDFIAAIFGCFYAGAVAVPVHPPAHSRLLPRVASIVADIDASFVLTTDEVRSELKPVFDQMPEGGSLRWCAVDIDEIDTADDWASPDISSETTAFVQYTSGSTGVPKGVQLTHGNLLANLEDITSVLPADARVASWLPLHHDMGLIGVTFGVVYAGACAFLMPPSAFIQRPMRWLELISRYRANVAVGPNFAYDLCVERSTAEERAALDLTGWTCAFSGAEPVRATTMQRFAEAFAPAGFTQQAFCPVYGLAEATVFVSGNPDYRAAPTVRHVDGVALRENRIAAVPSDHPAAASIVGCGPAGHNQQILIVDPLTRRECRQDEVGEIWVSGANVAHGYWGKADETTETFKAHTSDARRGPYLRTGDLGFLAAGELFVTGRLKDVVIIRGRNYYPNDLEFTVQETHPGLLKGRGAAFSVTPENGPEQLIVVHEADRQQITEADADKVIAGIRTAITAEHGVPPHAVLLVDLLHIPTTSSGKIRRRACKQKFLDGHLEAFAQWQAPATATPQSPSPAQTGEAPARSARSAPEIEQWLVTHLGAELELPASEIDTTQPFAYYGLDSVRAIQLTTALEAWLGRKTSATLLYDYPTIELLADHLADAATAAVDATATPDRTNHVNADEPIAIIGIGCRFPGADGPSQFWQLLCNGVDAVTERPKNRWAADEAMNSASHSGGFLDHIDGFDAQFFGISPREATRMDPQQRLLLEVAWHALEDAGQVPETLAGTRTGVFTGVSAGEYQHLTLSRPDLIDPYSGTGTSMSIAANRLSYIFDLRGPSMSVDTACSSSLVAVHMACRSLRDGESTLALVGGVNVMLTPGPNVSFERAGVLAADGRCKPFDARADGWVRGEGAGVVVLKPLSRALADGDSVYAVIRGSAVNQDGRTNGLMAPNRQSQQSVLTDAYQRAGVSPGAVQYVEAQGLGTLVGDAIEAEALGAVLAEGRAPDDPCMIGSVKTNIGHLEAAAGVAGLIKVALSLRHRTIPPTLNFSEPSPDINFETLPLRVAERLMPWPDSGRAVAGVSAFGFGGTNAHVVLAEAPQVRVPETADDATCDDVHVLPLSARSPDALVELARRYEGALAGGAPLSDLCYTAGVRRAHHEHRLAVVGHTRDELRAALAAHGESAADRGSEGGQRRPSRRPGVVFVFTGDGTHWRGMGRELHTQEAAFRDALISCDRALRPHLGRSVLGELLSEADDSDLDVAAAAVFAVQVALAALWRSWGVQPAAVIGHSMGEVAAAHVAGALSLDDAAHLICVRTRLIRRHNDRAARTELNEVLGSFRLLPTAVPLYSTVTGGALGDEVLDDNHWMANLSAPVGISSAMHRLAEAGHDTFLEISPHPTLHGEDALGSPARTVLPSMRADEPDRMTLLGSLGGLYSNGHSVAWGLLHPPGRRLAPAPTYPWQRRRFWLDDAAPTIAGANQENEPALPEPQIGFAGLLDRADQQERQRLLLSYLRRHAADKLGVTPLNLDTRSPLTNLGVDSLMAAELRAQIERDTGIVVPVVEFLDAPSVAELAGRLAEGLSGARSQQPNDNPPHGVPATTVRGAEAGTDLTDARWADLLTRVDEVSDADVEALLHEVLHVEEEQK